MKLETVIRHCFEDYPTLYQNRDEVLDHMYCVIGNGYEWIDGELVPGHNGKRYPRKRRKPQTAYTEACSMVYDDRAFMKREKRERDRERYEDMKEVWRLEHKPIPTFAQWRRGEVQKWKRHYEKEFAARKGWVKQHYYPLCRYSRVLNVPDDVKQDYLDGAFEVLELVIKAPVQRRSFKINDAVPLSFMSDRYRDDYLKANRKNRVIAREALATLEKRFPGRRAKR